MANLEEPPFHDAPDVGGKFEKWTLRWFEWLRDLRLRVNERAKAVLGSTDEIIVTDDGDGTYTIGLSVPVLVTKGGTGAIILTDGGQLLGSGTAAITALAQATNGQLAIGSTGLDPVLGLITGVANETDVTVGAGTITIGIIDPLIVAKGGSGGATFTDHGFLVGSDAAAFTALAAATDGQVPIGSTGLDPVPNEIDGTAGQIDVTNGAGTITLSLAAGAISGVSRARQYFYAGF